MAAAFHPLAVEFAFAYTAVLVTTNRQKTCIGKQSLEEIEFSGIRYLKRLLLTTNNICYWLRMGDVEQRNMPIVFNRR